MSLQAQKFVVSSQFGVPRAFYDERDSQQKILAAHAAAGQIGGIKMLRTGRRNGAHRASLFCYAALVAAVGCCASAYAQETSASGELAEIVVTAQKREQDLQDVPVAVTALSAEALESNRIQTFTDLDAIAPNLSIRASPGGVGLPAISMRGLFSNGGGPGQDKEVALYLDGVYIASARASLFDMPDIERIEVLRGPQGTLFGRNSTGGAISVVTPDPSGKFGVTQTFTGGNYSEFASKTRIDFPQLGDFSASLSYMHDQRLGDIHNLGAGTTWNRTGAISSQPPIETSPAYLGNKSLDAFLVAAKYEPNDSFKLTYKFDYANNRGSPDGVAPIALLPGAAGAIGSQPTPVVLDPSGRRPGSVNNSWDTPDIMQNYGHNLKANLTLTEHLTLQNILAYRHYFAYSNYQYDGLGGLVNTVPFFGPVGAPFVIFASNNQGEGHQYSDETQLNFDSKPLTLTAGMIYLQSEDDTGPAPGLAPYNVFQAFPGFQLPVTFPALSQIHNVAHSYAAYTQGEIHLTSQLDLDLGARLTKDVKSAVLSNPNPESSAYEGTRPTYLASLNYNLNDDTLVYGKFSTGFVSGGSVGGIAFQPETAESWEAGFKSELLDRRLRTNLAVFYADYHQLQVETIGSLVNRPDLSLVIIDLGKARAQGAELEVEAAPVRHVKLGVSGGYTDFNYLEFTPLATQLLGPLGTYAPIDRSKWTAAAWAEYATDPIFGKVFVTLRTDANWRSAQRMDTTVATVPEFIQVAPGFTQVNARLALQGFTVGRADAEVALWGKNLANYGGIINANIIAGLFESANFVEARTFGADLTIKF